MLLSACASNVAPATGDTPMHVRVQSSVLAPDNGGALIGAADLEPGDVLLSSVASLTSSVFDIRLATFAPISHALLYLGDGQVSEAVGSGARTRALAELINEEQMVVAFRVPDISCAETDSLRRWARSQVGTRYNTTGVLLSAPFVLNRRACELPLVPTPARNFCVTGLASIQLGVSDNDRFFCSQFVLEAFRQAGHPITNADPRWVSLADLLHMREGDVPSIPATQPLRYVGHLKYNPPPVIAVDGAQTR